MNGQTSAAGLDGTRQNEDMIALVCFRIYGPQTRPGGQSDEALRPRHVTWPLAQWCDDTHITHDNDSHINMSTQFGPLIGSL